MKSAAKFIEPLLVPIKFIFRLVPNPLLSILYRLTMPFDFLVFVLLRYLIVQGMVKECGTNIAIFSNVYLKNITNMKIGSNVSLHSLTYIDAIGGLDIGDNVSIAHNCSILTFEHGFNDKNIAIKYQPSNFNKVVINEDVWIGAGVRILSGAFIKSRTVIGAGAVVSKVLEPNGVYVGVPSKRIKDI